MVMRSSNESWRAGHPGQHCDGAEEARYGFFTERVHGLPIEHGMVLMMGGGVPQIVLLPGAAAVALL